MQDFLVIFEDKRQALMAADLKKVKWKAYKLALKFHTKVLEIKTLPLRLLEKEKECGFLSKSTCLISKEKCPFIDRIMLQCKSFTEKED